MFLSTMLWALYHFLVYAHYDELNEDDIILVKGTWMWVSFLLKVLFAVAIMVFIYFFFALVYELMPPEMWKDVFAY